jgi:tripartite-type tricarboxylate transporter receptor subunit TctC
LTNIDPKEDDMKPIAVRSLSDAGPVQQRRAFLVAALGMAGGTALSFPLRSARAGADPAWPTRTVRIITLAAPGAGTDAVARTLTDALSRRWAQPVVIDNRPGGDGIVSIETFLAAREGNHTLLFNPNGVWTALPLMHEQLAFDPVRDLIPLCFVVQDFIALAATPGLGAITLTDLVARARAEPGKLTWACAPSVPFLAFTAFLKEKGLDLTYVPYRNPIAALPDLAEGRVHLAFLPLAPLIGPAQAGKLRLVAIASDDRAPLAPDVPTARQAGFPTLSLFGGHGLFAPKEMPEPLRTHIGGDVRAILADADVARRLTAMGYIPRADSTAEFAAMLDRERVRWTEVARMYGAKPPQ